MIFIVHVIDDYSNHEFINGKFTLVLNEIKENFENYDILRSDAFYIVNDQTTAIDAVVNVTQKIQIKISDDNYISLASFLKKQYKEQSVKDFGIPENDEIIDIDCNIFTKSNSHFFITICKIPKTENNSNFIEYHKIHFYVIEENKIVLI